MAGKRLRIRKDSRTRGRQLHRNRNPGNVFQTEKVSGLSDNRGDSRKQKHGGAKHPIQKRRLRFASDEVKALKAENTTDIAAETDAVEGMEADSGSVAVGCSGADEDVETDVTHTGHKRKNKYATKVIRDDMDTAVGQNTEAGDKNLSEADAFITGETDKPSGPRAQKNRKKKAQRKRTRIYFEAEKKKQKGRPFTAESNYPKAEKFSPDAELVLTAVSDTVRERAAHENEDENAAVEGALWAERTAERAAGHAVSVLRKRRQKRLFTHKRNRRNQSGTRRAGVDLKSRYRLQQKRIRRIYADRKRSENMTTAVQGTIDAIRRMGGRVTDFFKENRKVYAGIAMVLILMMLLMSSVSSCAGMFLQNVVTYAATSYLSADEDICQAEQYYTQLEADLQEKIDRMENNHPGYDEYRYDIDEIGHNPFELISYLSAKYEVFTFAQVKPELDRLFAQQYSLQTESKRETVTRTRLVRVGESLGNVVTSGYCNCSICCGQWAGGPTASGVMPRADHTIAVDAASPFVPIGTRVVMNGVEYKVEDTGAFARYGVQFDVYYDSHSAASAHGHKTWEAFLADDNGDREIEVKVTETIRVFNVTLTNKGLTAVAADRLDTVSEALFEAYGETRGNLQMFASPFTFNWYGSISSYYGYRIHPITGNNQMHNGIDIAAAGGTKVSAGLDGTVTTSAYNDSYGNYVIIKDSSGYELRYAHLQSRSVSAGAVIRTGDAVGKVGSTGASTGNHLHMEVLKNGERLNPLFYVETGTEGGSDFTGGTAASGKAAAFIAEAKKYIGTPYVWGGYSPSGFDCSGFVSYCLTHSGAKNTGHIGAQALYDMCRKIPQSQAKAGDLVFFEKTYNTPGVSHVGIYLGNGQMLHCGNPVKIVSIDTAYWRSHLYGFGRW